VATEREYLINQEEKKGKPARIIVGEPMPEEKPVLPNPDDLSKIMATGGQEVSDDALTTSATGGQDSEQGEMFGDKNTLSDYPSINTSTDQHLESEPEWMTENPFRPVFENWMGQQEEVT
jgi:hypothetical protein